MGGMHILIGVLLLLAIALAGAGLSAKKRRDALCRLADEHGWSFHRRGEPFAKALAHFPLLSKGHTRRAGNVLQGGSGSQEVWIFDYRYTQGHGKHHRVHRQTVVAFPYLDVNLPAFEVRPEHMLHRVAQALGYQDIDLPELPDFSSAFLLRGKDEPAIRQLFDAEIARPFDGAKRLSIEGAGSCILVYQHRRMVRPDRIMSSIEKARTIRDAFVLRCQRLGWMARSVEDLVTV